MRYTTFPIAIFLITAAALSTFAQSSGNEARTLAQDAISIIREHPFEGEYMEKAAEKIKKAGELDPKEPYVFIAASRLVQRLGYHSGDEYKLSSYEPEAVQTAAALAQKAIDLGPQVSDGYVRLASVDITLRKFPEAQQALYTAHQLDPEAFLPWYVQGVWYWYQGQAKKCEAALAGAEARAKTPRDRRTLVAMRADMAQSRGNVAEEERLLKELIAFDPGDAWSHGNYGLFLMRNRRYEEAVVEYEKAVALAPYPIAVEQLKQARELRDQQRKRNGG